VTRRRAVNRAVNLGVNRAVNRAVNRRRAIAGAAIVTGIAAALVAGYAAAGATGLIDVASVATLGVLIAARAALRVEKPRPEKRRQDPARRPAVRAADFPAYATVASDLEWARMSRRHYEHAFRPRLARLAATLGKSDTVTIPSLTGPADTDGPGADLATLERVITQLEGP
jgi:hypothetical protein